MTVQFNVKPGSKVLELGGGANPMLPPKCMGGESINVDTRICYTPDGKRTVDFEADFHKPLPVTTEEFDAVISRFVLEHISYTKTKQFIAEMYRAVKPGGKVICIIPDTESQLKWVQSHPNGWDDKPIFESASCILFGDQQHSEREGDHGRQDVDSHKAYFSPPIISQLFQSIGFGNIIIQPYGERATDMVIEAVKPIPVSRSVSEIQRIQEGSVTDVDRPEIKIPLPPVINTKETSSEDRAKIFDRKYFDGGRHGGGYAPPLIYLDFPCHNITAYHVLARRPESVLELGAGRGYIGKRLEDAGIKYVGLDISKHCFLTRACEPVSVWDICKIPWPVSSPFDLCLSISLLELIPEACIPDVVGEMARICKRGLHGVDFGPGNGIDKTKVNLKPREWWMNVLPPGHEVVDKEELEKGDMPSSMKLGDRKTKLNIGCALTMFPQGWVNMDIIDQASYAHAWGYKFQQCDVRNGLPYQTGTVDLIYSSHQLEHLTLNEGLQFLRECRRVLKPTTGAMRIIVPDAEFLINKYSLDSPYVYGSELEDLDELNENCANATTRAGKLYSILHDNHKAIYDWETLKTMLEDSGFVANRSSFRKNEIENPGIAQILRETIDCLPCLSLFCNAIPLVG